MAGMNEQNDESARRLTAGLEKQDTASARLEAASWKVAGESWADVQRHQRWDDMLAIAQSARDEELTPYAIKPETTLLQALTAWHGSKERLLDAIPQARMDADGTLHVMLRPERESQVATLICCPEHAVLPVVEWYAMVGGRQDKWSQPSAERLVRDAADRTAEKYRLTLEYDAKSAVLRFRHDDRKQSETRIPASDARWAAWLGAQACQRAIELDLMLALTRARQRPTLGSDASAAERLRVSAAIAGGRAANAASQAWEYVSGLREGAPSLAPATQAEATRQEQTRKGRD